MSSVNIHLLIFCGEMTMVVDVGEKVANKSESLSLISWC